MSGLQRKTWEKRQGAPCKNCGSTERYGGSYSCVPCTNRRSAERKQTAAYKAQAKVYWMGKRYGLTPGQASEMLLAQGHKCASCGATSPGNKNGWVVDHCHSTGKVRGILCHGCNVGLGAFDDSTERMEAAIRYIKSHV